MKVSGIFRGLMILGAGAAGTLACTSAAFAQGCALCYTDAAATGPHAEAALRHGILVLMIPPTLIITGLFSILYYRRNVYREAIKHASIAVRPEPRIVSEVMLRLN